MYRLLVLLFFAACHTHAEPDDSHRWEIECNGLGTFSTTEFWTTSHGWGFVDTKTGRRMSVMGTCVAWEREKLHTQVIEE